MESINKYRIQKRHVIYLFMFLISRTCVAQSSVGFLKYDQATYNRTINKVYQSWYDSKISKKHRIDTILCVFVISFDTLDLKRVRLDEEVLKKNMKFLLHMSAEKFQRNKETHTEYSDSIWSAHNPDLYDCRCDMYGLNMNKIASIDSQQGFYVFEKYPDKFSYSEALKTRLIKLEDQMVFRPSSKKYTLNFKWRLAINKNGTIVWYNIDSPNKSYSSEEIFLNHWDHFFL